MSTQTFKSPQAASNVNQKPPMIFVYTNDNNEFFRRIYSSLNSVLPENTYSIFHISSKSFTNDPWMDELTACVIVADQNVLTNQMQGKLKTCTKKGIKLICNETTKTCLNISHDIFVADENADVKLKKIENDDDVFIASSSINGIHSLFCNLKLEKFPDVSFISNALKILGFEVNKGNEIPDLTPGYFVCQRSDLEKNGLKEDNEIGDAPKLLFNKIVTDRIVPSATLLPIEICDAKDVFPDGADFDAKTYFSNLKTTLMGKALLFIPVCETTINISKSLRIAMPNIDGILVVAGCQTNGVGRTGNQWISPKGCAMFTFNYNIPLESPLFQDVAFVEYIFAVSVCDAIKSFIGFENFPVSIKWPNDIYYKRQCKIGGTMVTFEKGETKLECIVSAGINVANSKPTICINDLISAECDKHLTVEEVIAKVLKKFEYYTAKG